MKKVIKKQMNDSLICSVKEAEDAFDFVAELMDLYREHTEKTEPNATVSIEAMRRAYYQIRNLQEFVMEELEKGE